MPAARRSPRHPGHLKFPTEVNSAIRDTDMRNTEQHWRQIADQNPGIPTASEVSRHGMLLSQNNLD
ncbi:MAG: hypothetical protein HC824_01545 [Synechococcales cyanobacterium RM1_1_8]|nr:hypothetical protein [Synechococcales cyanobacterium RM1_1_8]